MKPLSTEAKAVLSDYRSIEALGAEARARVIESMSRRIATQSWPADDCNVAPPEPVTQGVLAKAMAGMLGKIGLAVLGLSVPAAWLAHSAGTSDGQARTLISLSPGLNDLARVTAPRGGAIRPELFPPDSTSEPPVIGSNAAGHEPRATARPLSVRAHSRDSAPPNVKESEPLSSTVDSLESKGQPSLAPGAAGAVPSDMIDEEVRLLTQAHAALRAGRPREALAKLREHEKNFVNSKLADARRVARMIALCDSGRRETARAEAQAFLASRPTSPLADRVRKICAAPNVLQPR